MDYSKSGNPKPDRNTPRHAGARAPGKPPAGRSEDEKSRKAALLARMKAVAGKAATPGGDA
ncbi:hypothetical protein [Pseudogemmobacter sonorensis]|uniref:hypothetical protein n=1 Tax=Pseudogemmobacter sonorensis TaxID=2989681 RepID=UPI0036C70B49